MAEGLTVSHLIWQFQMSTDVDGARHEILNLIVQRTIGGSTTYFSGWDGFATTPVLRSVAQVLQSMKDAPPELCFGRIIYIDCSLWKSKRVMQRRIAEELKLDRKTMIMFEKQDEEDNFNGVDPASRDAIRGVAAAIDRKLRETSFAMIFLNGSDEAVDLSRLGVVPGFRDDCIVIWTFTRKFPSSCSFTLEELENKLRYTDVVVVLLLPNFLLPESYLIALVHEEIGSTVARNPCAQDKNRAIFIDCYKYVLYLNHSFYSSTRQLWAAHGANYWICDGIIQGGTTREIIEALYQQVSFQSDYGNSAFAPAFMRHPDSPYMVFDDHYDDQWEDANTNRRPHRWISITSKNLVVREKMKNILARASSVFLPFDITTTSSPQGLPDDLMEQCSKLRVLLLCNCSFNFLSPVFGHCSTLRFLGLDHCINNRTIENPVEREEANKWAFLSSLWVVDLRYTDWDEIISKEKMDLMGMVMELNIQGSKSLQRMVDQLEGRLPYLQRLRIVKPTHEAEETPSSVEIDNSPFMEKTNLQVLDLSGNKDMKILPTSLSKASSLEVLVVDGCDGLENVVLSNCLLLRSFSFDGYGPASNWTSWDELPQQSHRPSKGGLKDDDADKKKNVKTSWITLEGCTLLKNLFLRGLTNLVELDLSGCAIKILDFETMAVDVPRLKRLFLLGCQHLCAIRWGPDINDIFSLREMRMAVDLELLCIDTRPGDGRTRPSIVHEPNEKHGLQVHAITADERLVRSFWDPIRNAAIRGTKLSFDVHITSSNIISDENKTSTEEEPRDYYQLHHVVARKSLYDDVYTEVVDSSLTPMQAFPQPPTSRLDCHIEIDGDGSYGVGSEFGTLPSVPNLADLMLHAESMYVHDASNITTMPGWASSLLRFRVERCPRLDPVFPPPEANIASSFVMETIWASHLLMAHCILSPGETSVEFHRLRHLHLCSCPSLQFALPVCTSFFPSLVTLHIIHCGSLKHVFALDKEKKNISNALFPELTTIHLHDLPALQQILEVKMMMIAPKLETVKTRGCWNLRRLPALGELALEAAGERRRPAVEMEKDVWDALEWDGMDGGHDPSLYQAPVHSRYYKSRRHLRGTVLR